LISDARRCVRDPIQGYGQGHMILKVGYSSIFKNHVRGVDCRSCTWL